MKKIIIEYYLATLAIFLMSTVNVRTEPGVNLSQKSWDEINSCVEKAKEGKNGETLTSTSDILANMEYKSQTRFFDLIFGKMVAATAENNQPLNKCLIIRCLSDIKRISLDHTKPSRLINNVISKIKGDQYEFAKGFINHIKEYSQYKYSKLILMNINSFCTAQACMGELGRAGFIYSTIDENKQFSSGLSVGDSDSPTQSVLVSEYKNHLNSEIPGKFSVEEFCVTITCIHELGSAGFLSDLNGLGNWKLYHLHKSTIDNLLYLNFVRGYVSHLTKFKTADIDPNSYCESVATKNGNFILNLNTSSYDDNIIN